MNNTVYAWQEGLWQKIQQMRASLPHAILFHGPSGIGKTTFVEHFAQSLLCENILPDGHACGVCASCGWFSQYSHPDYRRIRPGVLDALESQAEGEAEEEAGEAKSGGKTSSKAPSKAIRIEQVRALSDFMNISTHRQGRRVVVLYPAESLGVEAANSLLKMLEEPAPGTVFLLVSSNIDRLLPTVLSRCRKIPLPLPAREESLQWLLGQGVKEAEVWLAEQGGSPLTALELSQAGGREEMDEFLAHLSKPSVVGALKIAERLQKAPVKQSISWMQRWLYDIFSLRYTGVVRYYPRYKKELAVLAAQSEPAALLSLLKAVSTRNLIAEHPLVPRLFLEDMLLEYLEVVS